MPRKGPAVRREVLPDPVYQNPLVTQLINKVLLHGKKTVAESTVYKALEIISERTANDPVITLKKAVENVRPMLEVKSRRVGGASYQVHHPRAPLARELQPGAPRELDGRAVGRRDHGRLQRHRNLSEAA